MSSATKVRACVIFAFGVVLGSSARGQTTWYVDQTATGGANDGTSWTDAFVEVQDVLAVALSGDQVWVAQGIYLPDYDVGLEIHTGDRAATFQLLTGVKMYGGFPTGGGTFEQRDPEAYPTVLSGDLNGDDGPDFVNYGENSYHVVTGSGTDETTVVSGFTVTGGYSDSSGDDTSGAGMLNDSGSPTVIDCSFSGNWAPGDAGGMYNIGASSPTLTNCVFIGNVSNRYAGGMENSNNSNPILTDCMFSGNSASLMAGGMFNFNSSPRLVNCTFSGNTTLTYGGGMFSSGGAPTLVNCAFTGNTADGPGGGMGSHQSDSTVTNCTFSANVASGGRALACVALGGDPSNLLVTNCILWDGGDEILNDDGSTLTITYSDVEGGWPGQGNLNRDPLFVDADGPDDIPGTADDNLRRSIRSPCTDAGDNRAVPEEVTVDLGGGPRFLHDPQTPVTGYGLRPVVDMGGYEFFADCNENEVRDDSDIFAGTSADCNENRIPDECELAGGTSADLNDNGVLDECEGPKNRYLTLVPDSTTSWGAYRVTLTASADFPGSTGIIGWVGEPFEADYYRGVWIARVVDMPVFYDWSEGPQLIYVGDCPIVPVATYEIWWTPDGQDFYDPVVVPTAGRPQDKYWGDVVGIFDWSWAGPDGVVNMDDIMAAIEKFKETPTAPPLAWVDVEPEVPNAFLNFTDIFQIVQGFLGQPYPFSDPVECP